MCAAGGFIGLRQRAQIMAQGMAADFGAFPAGVFFTPGRQAAVFAEAGDQTVEVIAFEI
ncbi:hypothetical protein D3C80_1354020 [compost metagenome]